MKIKLFSSTPVVQLLDQKRDTNFGSLFNSVNQTKLFTCYLIGPSEDDLRSGEKEPFTVVIDKAYFNRGGGGYTKCETKGATIEEALLLFLKIMDDKISDGFWITDYEDKKDDRYFIRKRSSGTDGEMPDVYEVEKFIRA